MAKFRNRPKTKQDNTPNQLGLTRDTEKPWEKITSGFKGGQKYSREWNSGYDGPNKGTW